MRKLTLSLALAVTFTVMSSFSAPEGDKYAVDAASSSVKWTGYHLAKSYEHWGNVTIKSGFIELEGEDVIGGEIVIDMSSITNGDQEEEKDRKKLVNHLKSDDFFNAQEYPESRLVIKSAENAGGGKYNVTADITIRGITEEIQFEANRNVSGETVEFSAKVSVDRTKHEVMYGWKIENAILSNNFDLDVKLVASK